MPTLVLLRHAKAEPSRPDDHARRLAPRGREQCEEVRRWLTAQGLLPDRVVVSSSARTVETWELAGVGTAVPEVDGRVYEASVEDLRAVVAETDPSVGTLVLVGHNPSIERFAWELDDSPEARERSDRGMGTAGIAVLSLDDWSVGSGRLVAFEA
jgi:phosphohistidine phosphatase